MFNFVFFYMCTLAFTYAYASLSKIQRTHVCPITQTGVTVEHESAFSFWGMNQNQCKSSSLIFESSVKSEDLKNK